MRLYKFRQMTNDNFLFFLLFLLLSISESFEVFHAVIPSILFPLIALERRVPENVD